MTGIGGAEKAPYFAYPLDTIQPSMFFPVVSTEYFWPLSTACLSSQEVVARVSRQGSNCLDPDYVPPEVVVPEPALLGGLSAWVLGLLALTRRRG